jgi:HSP20 family protein
MTQPRWDPFAGLGSLQREINRLVEDFLEGRAPWGQDIGTQKPAVDVTDTPEALIIRVQVPGVDKDDLHLTVTHETLTIRGEVRAAETGQNVFQREFRYGPFARTIPLPVTVQAEQASAQLKDGILTVTLPKSAQAQGRDIPIQT